MDKIWWAGWYVYMCESELVEEVVNLVREFWEQLNGLVSIEIWCVMRTIKCDDSISYIKEHLKALLDVSLKLEKCCGLIKLVSWPNVITSCRMNFGEVKEENGLECCGNK